MSDSSWLNPPLDKAMGCLPRDTKPGTLAPLMSDRVQLIPRGEWDGLCGQMELDKCVNKIKDQDGVGSCATESTTQGVEVVAEFAGYEWVELNPWSIYRVTSGGSDRGSNIDRNLEFARDVGILPEAYWPRSQGWRKTPPSGWEEEAAKYRIDEWYDLTAIEEVGTALLLGFPCVVGWTGHSELIVDLLPGARGLVVNSWAPTWGDNGRHVVELSKINWGYGAYAIRSVVDRADQ